MERRRSWTAGPTVQITNLSGGDAMVSSARVADSLAARLRGLIGSAPLGPGDGLLISPCSSIHTFWMSFPIDVIYLSSAQEVEGIDHSLAPWRLGSFHRNVHSVLELPAGTAEALGVRVGDRLLIHGSGA